METLNKMVAEDLKVIRDTIKMKNDEANKVLIIIGETDFVTSIKTKCLKKDNSVDVQVGKTIGMKIPEKNNIIFDAKNTWKTNLGFEADNLFIPSKTPDLKKKKRDAEYSFQKNYLRREMFDGVSADTDAFNMDSIDESKREKAINKVLEGIDTLIIKKEKAENEEAYAKIDRLLKAKKPQKANEVTMMTSSFIYKGKELALEQKDVLKIVEKHPEIEQSTRLKSLIKDLKRKKDMQKILSSAKVDIEYSVNEIYGVPQLSHKKLNVIFGDGDIAKIVKYIEENPDEENIMLHESQI